MSAAYLTMSHRELDRSEVMHRLLERRLSHRQARDVGPEHTAMRASHRPLQARWAPGAGVPEAEAFDRVPKARIQPGDVVDNKLLSRALEMARQQQVDTENERVEHSRTKRDRRLAAARLAAAATG